MNDSVKGIIRTGEGHCNGSFGELLQGVLPGQKRFLVNLKIKNHSRARVHLSSCQYMGEKEARYAESYRRYSKSYKILRNILTDLGCHDDYLIEIDSDIPVGKGLSSSTADMVATVRAAEQALSVPLKNEYVSRMITEIEPNDGLNWPGSAAYHHTTGVLIYNWDYVPPLRILGLDLGGTIDTVEFNKKPRTWSEAETGGYRDLLKEVADAYERKDADALCRIATESTRRWQSVLPKAELPAVEALMAETGAKGIINTHSGSFLGLIYGAGHPDLESVKKLAQTRLPSASPSWFETVSVP